VASDAQEKIYGLLGRSAPEGDAPSFSHFDPVSAGQADELAAELSRIAGRDGVDAAIARAYEVADEGSLGVAKYALKLFVTHDDESARDLTIPAVEIGNSEPLPPADADEQSDKEVGTA
jgi:hypothetical protein